MNRFFIKALGIALTLAFSAPAIAGPFEDGETAVKQQDYATALKIFRPLAEAGDPRAQNQLAWMYESGLGVPRDKAEGERWTRKAAEQGNSEAELNLGFKYDLYEPKDYAQAIAWYRKAADHGNAMAQEVLGATYYQGKIAPQNFALAVEWFRKAADQGDFDAQHSLGLMYEQGQGVPQDYVRAHMWLNLAIASAANSKYILADMPEEVAKRLADRERIAAKMTPEQIAEAQRLASAWTPIGGQGNP